MLQFWLYSVNHKWAVINGGTRTQILVLVMPTTDFWKIIKKIFFLCGQLVKCPCFFKTFKEIRFYFRLNFIGYSHEVYKLNKHLLLFFLVKKNVSSLFSWLINVDIASLNHIGEEINFVLLAHLWPQKLLKNEELLPN